MSVPPSAYLGAQQTDQASSPGPSERTRLLIPRGARSPPNGDEQALGTSYGYGSVPTQFGSFGARRRSFFTHKQDVPIEDLQSDLARIGSFSSIQAAAHHHHHHTSDHTPSISRKPSVAANLGNVPEEALYERDDVSENVEPYEKTGDFMNISNTHFYLMFSVVMLCVFIACFDSTLMASSHPIITSYFGVSQAASWLSTVFLISSTACQPLFGRVSDSIGRRPVFVAALVILALTTVWCGVAGTIESFIAARAFCGIGAGGTMSLAFIVVSDCVTLERRGIYQSHINMAFGLGSFSGAAFGGFLCDTIGWRWAFGFQVPIIAVGIVLAFFFTPKRLGPMYIEDKDGPWEALKRFDFTGSALLIITITALILALNLGGNIYPWDSPQVIACFVVFGVVTPIFFFNETKAVQPLMPIELLTQTPIANLIYINLLGLIATNTVLFNVPLFFQAVLLTSASDSGFRLAVPTLLGACAGISVGYIITWTQRLKPTLVLGAVVYVIGAVSICFISNDISEFGSLVLITGVPFGQGFAFPTSMMSALAISEQEDQAIVTTTIGLFRNLGTVLGVAISSLVFQNALRVQLEEQVTVPGAARIIERVRESVSSIKKLEGLAQQQVISAYADSLRMAFIVAAVSAILLFILAVPVRLPRLTKGQKIIAHAGAE